MSKIVLGFLFESFLNYFINETKNPKREHGSIVAYLCLLSFFSCHGDDLISPLLSSLLFVAFLGWWLVWAGQHFGFLTFGGVSQENVEPVPLVVIPQSRALKIQVKL